MFKNQPIAEIDGVTEKKEYVIATALHFTFEEIAALPTKEKASVLNMLEVFISDPTMTATDIQTILNQRQSFPSTTNEDFDEIKKFYNELKIPSDQITDKQKQAEYSSDKKYIQQIILQLALEFIQDTDPSYPFTYFTSTLQVALTKELKDSATIAVSHTSIELHLSVPNKNQPLIKLIDSFLPVKTVKKTLSSSEVDEYEWLVTKSSNENLEHKTILKCTNTVENYQALINIFAQIQREHLLAGLSTLFVSSSDNSDLESSPQPSTSNTFEFDC